MSAPYRRDRVFKVELVEGHTLVGLLTDYTRAAEQLCEACGLRAVDGGQCGCVPARVAS